MIHFRWYFKQLGWNLENFSRNVERWSWNFTHISRNLGHCSLIHLRKSKTFRSKRSKYYSIFQTFWSSSQGIQSKCVIIWLNSDTKVAMSFYFCKNQCTVEHFFYRIERVQITIIIYWIPRLYKMVNSKPVGHLGSTDCIDQTQPVGDIDSRRTPMLHRLKWTIAICGIINLL